MRAETENEKQKDQSNQSYNDWYDYSSTDREHFGAIPHCFEQIHIQLAEETVSIKNNATTLSAPNLVLVIFK